MDDMTLYRVHKVYALDFPSFFLLSSLLFNDIFFPSLLYYSGVLLAYFTFGSALSCYYYPNLFFSVLFFSVLFFSVLFFSVLFFSYYLPIRSTSSPLHLTPPQAGIRVQNAQSNGGGPGPKKKNIGAYIHSIGWDGFDLV